MYYQINQSQYPEHLTAPMAAELTENGFESLRTPESVNEVLSKEDGTVFVIVNSVCGCAARNARPAAVMATREGKLPNKMVTVFAGVDGGAVQTARDFMLPYPPSSPSMALFKDGKLVHFIERHNIEGRDAQSIALNLKKAFETYC
ncbi:MAG: BrxA/BrxB family bacilliredoxin [Saprospiraceae bacterium]|nr:BrxA/BrxB family bacilliredoxin [Saprospiraceae bacterium]